MTFFCFDLILGEIFALMSSLVFLIVHLSLTSSYELALGML